MTKAWIDWEKNQLLLTREQFRKESTPTKKQLSEFFYEALWLLYCQQFAGMEYAWQLSPDLAYLPEPEQFERILQIQFSGEDFDARIDEMIADPAQAEAKAESLIKGYGHTVMNRAREDAATAAEASGIGIATKTWDATLDERTRPTHVLLHGVQKLLNEPFRTVNGSAQCPGAFGVPEEDCNCRCVLDIDLLGNYKRYDGQMSYTDWIDEVLQNAAKQ